MIAAQLYTLREFTKTPADIAKTLARVKKIGYDAVQASALGPIDAKELAKILSDNGLTCVATHVPLVRLENELPKVIEEHRLWGCKWTATGGFFPTTAITQDWIDFAHKYNGVAKKLAGSGLSLGYHNHSHELSSYGDKPGETKTGLQLLLENFDSSVWMEIDTYWIAHGGGDPAAWIARCGQMGKGRIPCVHVKDMRIKLDRTQFMAEIGEGNLNWPAILSACKAAGVEHLLVEQDVCYRDPFESLEISRRNLKAMGAG